MDKPPRTRRFCPVCDSITSFIFNKVIGHSECSECGARFGTAWKEGDCKNCTHKIIIKVEDTNSLKFFHNNKSYYGLEELNGIECRKCKDEGKSCLLPYPLEPVKGTEKESKRALERKFLRDTFNEQILAMNKNLEKDEEQKLKINTVYGD